MEDKSLAQLSVNELLDRLASDAPTPGGGSAAALTGALAASLGRMVAALTIGKPKFAEVEPQVRTLSARLARAEGMLRKLIDEDSAAYGVLSEAFKLDKSDPTRAERIAQAAGLAGSVPLETAALSSKVRSDLEQLREVGNPLLQPDVDAGLHLARAALHAAAANVRANLSLMSEEDSAVIESQLQALVGDIPRV